MKYGIGFLILIMLFSGCIDISSYVESYNVVYVNVSTDSMGNDTIIRDINARGGTLPKTEAPPLQIPKKLPAIYVSILQPREASKGELFDRISTINGIEYNGPGNYTIIITLFQEKFNESLPLRVSVDISKNSSYRLARGYYSFNWTKNEE